MTATLIAIIFILSPVLIIILTEKSRLANQIGSILIAYGLGLLLGNINLYPSQSQFLSAYLSTHTNIGLADMEFLFSKGVITARDITAFKIYKIQDLLMTITVPVAIPLLLFSLSIKSWFRMAGKTLLSMLLGIGGLLIVITIIDLTFRSRIPGMDKIVGMLTGLYTGGTPNLAALKMMLNVDVDTYIKVHTYDMVPSLLYLIFLMSFGRSFFRKFLRPYPSSDEKDNKSKMEQENYSENGYSGIFNKNVFGRLMVALSIAVIIFGLSGMLSLLVGKTQQMMVVILTITTLSILIAMIPAVNRIKKTFELGMYFILVFSVTVASMADVTRLINISFNLFLAISLTIFGTLALHSILCRIFKVDADTLIITSTALVCSPPFVPPVAGALKNREIIVSGLTVGIIGYAVGNYLGVLVAMVL